MINAQLLRLKEAPYLMTVLLGFCAWILTHTVDRIQQSPIIEYRITEYRTNGTVKVRCEIENLCSDKVFTGIKFSLGGPRVDGESYSGGRAIVTAPTHRPEEFYDLGSSVAGLFPHFHPSWRVVFEATKHGTFTPYLQFHTMASSQDVQGVLLLRSGSKTFLVRHELKILATMLVVASLLGGWYLHWLNKAVGGGTTTNNPTTSKGTKTTSR